MPSENYLINVSFVHLDFETMTTTTTTATEDYLERNERPAIGESRKTINFNVNNVHIIAFAFATYILNAFFVRIFEQFFIYLNTNHLYIRIRALTILALDITDMSQVYIHKMNSYEFYICENPKSRSKYEKTHTHYLHLDRRRNDSCCKGNKTYKAHIIN